jgi:Arc/MetJ family transcription regulator
LTFGFGDEIEAGVRHPFDSERRSGKLSELQGGIKAYQAARPLESMAYELGGAVAPAILSLGSSAPVSAAAVGARVLPRLMQGSGIAPRLLRGTAAGAGGGAAYAVGTGEGSMGDRIKRATAGALGGGLAGLGGTAVLGGVSALTTKLVDIARERLGVSGTRAVTAELQRLATESGKSVDQIVQDLQSGSIMAENATLADAVRALARTSGGKAQADMQTGIKTRSSETFADAKTEIQRYLADSTDDNVRRQVRRSDDAARKAENEAYAIFETGTIGQEVQDQVTKAIRAVPSSADDIQTALLARGAEPLFNMVEGSPVFTRSPTPIEAEIVRRSINDSTTAAFKRSAGTVGTAFGDVERGLRNSIALRTSRDSFLAGQGSIASGADQVEIDFAGLPTDDAIASYRAGFMDILRRKFQGQQPASIMAQLRNETAEGVAGEKNLGLIFRTVFPEEPMEDVVRRIGIASKGQDMKALLGGSGTAPTASAAKRAGSSFNAEEFIGAATGSTMDLGRLLRRFINRDGVDLTDAQNQEVVRVLLSENPDFVRRAMTDQTGWGALDRAVAQTLERLAIGGTRAATVGGAGVSVGLLGPQ